MRRPPVLAFALIPFILAAGDRPLHLFSDVAVSSGGRIASVESDDVARDGGAPLTHLLIRDGSGHVRPVRPSCDPDPACRPFSPTWNADGSRLAFLVEQPGGSNSVETVGDDGGRSRIVLSFEGPLDRLKFGPADRLAVLATAGAHKRVGATAAAAPMAGEIGATVDEQRIAVIDGALRFVSPADLYVYEYDWRPDGRGFVGTAAHGNGDSNWWIAKLFAFDESGGARMLFAPGPREQLAHPVVSPDGRSVAFIGGWMSDFGSTGGDAYLLGLDPTGTAVDRHAVPVDLTPGVHATTTWLDWHCSQGLTEIALSGPQTSVAALSTAGAHQLWSGEVTLGVDGSGLSCAGGSMASIRQSFTAPPEIVSGQIGRWRSVTHANDGVVAPAIARSIAWTDDGLPVQGWLLQPPGIPRGPRPMIVDVHGGPQAASTPEFVTRGLVRDLLAAGDDVFMPNYRGSFGGGEAFAQASIGDLGGGDWRDVLAGVDAAERAAPIDGSRLGIEGASYGGYMAMWAVTQTHRFRAAATDAGVSDWLSIEGEAPQAGSDDISFGGSVYDDDRPYLRASPIVHVRGTTTPTLITVGDRDVECPMPQSQEFYTALRSLGVPTRFVVYPDEGHGFSKETDRVDLRHRQLDWFSHWLAGADRH